MDSLKTVHEKTRRAYNLAAQKYHALFHDELNEKEYDRNLLDSYAARFARGALICDAGCGPSAHIGRYLADRGMRVVGVDISDRCIEMAKTLNPDMKFKRQDFMSWSFGRNVFDGIVSYYSIIHTPKKFIGQVFQEFRKVLKPGGYLLVAVKAGTDEGYIHELLEMQTEIYYSLFNEEELGRYFQTAGLAVEFLEKRNPYDLEIRSKRIFGIGRKTSRKRRTAW